MSMSLKEIDTQNKIRSLYLEGKNYKQIQEELNIPAGSWDSIYYRNEYGFRDFIQSIKKEYFIMKAEEFSRKLLNIDEQDDARMYAIKQKEVEFLRETLGKDNYSKKTEIDNTNPITINVKSYNNDIKSYSNELSSPTINDTTKQLKENNSDVIKN